MSDAPIFIIGTERSGSNLLRLILNAHSRIAIPHPPHIVRFFAPLEAGYGDLTTDAAFGQLVDDVLGLLRVHIHPWEAPVDRQRVLREARPRNAFGVFVALYDQFLAHTGKARWGCKSTFLIDYTPAILDRFPDARLILLTRDPRDVAVSSRESVFNPYHPYFTARLWTAQQKTGLGLLEELPPTSVCLLRYEDLLADARGELLRLCDFLDEPFEESMLGYFSTDAAQTTAALSRSWRNANQPILTGNLGRFRKGLSPTELALVESVAGEAMAAFGYELETSARPVQPGRLQLASFRLADAWWRLGVELGSLRRDRNHWTRWRRAVWLAYLGWRRGRPRA